MNNLKDDLRRSVVCTAVFAAVFGLTVACGKNSSPTTITENISGLIRLVSHTTPNMIGFPNNLNNNQPFTAAMFFQAAQQPAQIQQSFQGYCGADTTGIGSTPINYSGATNGFIPLQVPLDALIQIPLQSTQEGVCGGVFAQVGGGVDTLSGGTLTTPGTPMYFDGTLSTLVVTGRTLKGTVIRCSDLTATVQVHDQDLVQPYFVIDTNSVILAIGTNQLPFTCNLNVPPGDQASFISVQWAKV